MIASTLSGSMATPYADITCPKYAMELAPKYAFGLFDK
jgi:hypothetical protein